MKNLKLLSLGSAALMLAACASTPMGPTVSALPAPGKPFDVFQAEQFTCKQYAADQVRGQAENANERALLSGVVGTALGAGLGAAVDGGRGAAIGAAAGSVAGGGIGAGNSQGEQKSIQKQYNDAYTQCMYAKGNQIQQTYVPPATVVVTQPAPPPTIVYTQPAPAVVYQPAPQVIYQSAPR